MALGVFEFVDDCNVSLQSKILTLAAATFMAKQAVEVLNTMRRDSKFADMYSSSVKEARDLDIGTQQLPRVRRVARRIDDNPETSAQFASAEQYFRKHFFELIDSAVSPYSDTSRSLAWNLPPAWSPSLCERLVATTSQMTTCSCVKSSASTQSSIKTDCYANLHCCRSVEIRHCCLIVHFIYTTFYKYCCLPIIMCEMYRPVVEFADLTIIFLRLSRPTTLQTALLLVHVTFCSVISFYFSVSHVYEFHIK